MIQIWTKRSLKLFHIQGEKEKNGTAESTNKTTPESTEQSTNSAATPGSTTPAQHLPPPFHQVPFTRFPFPPMMSMPGFPPMSNTSVTNVPRFPPPPPFIPGMFPPGFMQSFMAAQQGNANFSMPPWPGYPYMMNPSTNNANMGSTSIGSSGNTAESVSVSASSSGAGNTNKGPVTTSASGVENKSNIQSQKSNVTKTENKVPVSESTEQAPQTNSDSQSIDKENSENDRAEADESVINQDEEIRAESSNIPESDSAREETMLRHRTIYNEAVSQTPRAGRVGQSAELQDHRNRQSGMAFSTILITLIGIAIAILLIRRFFLSRNWRFYYGF